MSSDNYLLQTTRLFIINVLTVVYLLSYSGLPISDDEQLYVSAARNISVIGTLSAEQLHGNTRIEGDYHGVEPAHPLLATLWLNLFSNTNFGTTQVIYILPIIYTVFSCVLILEISIKMGKSLQAGFIASLLYGLGTLAWPYAKTFLREPLINLVLLGSWLMYLELKITYGYKKILSSIVFFALLILLVFVKALYGVTWVAYLTMYILEKRVKKLDLSKENTFLVATALGILLMFVILTWNITDTNIFYRFTGGIIHDGLLHVISISHEHILEAILGSLFSPLKGLVFYSPIVILGFISIFLYWKKDPLLFILPVTVLTSMIVLQSLLFDEMWWTPTWGSRFLLPSISLLVISSLPIIQALLDKGWIGKLALILLLLGGMLIQLPAVLFNSSFFFSRTYNYTSEYFSNLLWDLFRSPIILQWRLFEMREFDLLLWRTTSIKPAATILFLIVVFLFILLSTKWLYNHTKEPAIQVNIPHARYLFSSICIIVILFGNLNMGKLDPAYRTNTFELLCEKIRNEIRADDALIVYSYPSELWDYFSNAECGQGRWYSLAYHYYNDSNSLEYKINTQLFSQLKKGNYSRLWFVSQYDGGFLSDFEQAEFENGHYMLVHDGYFLDPVPVYYALFELK